MIEIRDWLVSLSFALHSPKLSASIGKCLADHNATVASKLVVIKWPGSSIQVGNPSSLDNDLSDQYGVGHTLLCNMSAER